MSEIERLLKEYRTFLSPDQVSAIMAKAAKARPGELMPNQIDAVLAEVWASDGWEEGQ